MMSKNMNQQITKGAMGKTITVRTTYKSNHMVLIVPLFKVVKL
jgi:hypothetical protein